MGKYFKRFENHSQYEQYKQSENYIKPNISVCDNEQEIHYNTLFTLHKYVDLGLPSGTLWATENIKDSSGNDLYFAWGETQGYTAEQVGIDKIFNWEHYRFGTSNNLTKYNSTDGKTTLDTSDDAATVLWGSNWCIPTKENFQELIDNTTTVWTTEGKTGITFTSTINGNSVFFPALGNADYIGVNGIGEWGLFWSRSLYADNADKAWYFYFGSEEVDMYQYNRYEGYLVFPVRANN